MLSAPEGGEVSSAHSLRDAEVGCQRLSQARGGELSVLGDLSQQQAHQREPLGHRHPEAQRAHGRLHCATDHLRLRARTLVSASHQGPTRDDFMSVFAAEV